MRRKIIFQKNAQNPTLDPIPNPNLSLNLNLNPDPNPDTSYRTSSGKNPTFFFVENLVDHNETYTSEYQNTRLISTFLPR